MIHDEDLDLKLDTFLGVPREGFGFSGNPPIIKGKPAFDDVSFAFDGEAPGFALTVRMKYLL